MDPTSRSQVLKPQTEVKCQAFYSYWWIFMDNKLIKK